jgi:autophagy-related protein 18
VFSVPSGQRIYQFRRGTIPAKIYSINFNMQSNMLVVTSATDTVHIFRLARAAGLRGTLLGSASYLPEIVSEMWEPVRDFAHLKLPTTGLITAAALSHSSPQVMVLTSDGYFLVYNIDLENGGECVLLKQHSLLDSTGSSAGNSRSNSIDRSRQSSVQLAARK